MVKYNEGQPFFLNHREFSNAELSKELEMKVKYLNTFKGWIEERKRRPSFRKNEAFRQRKYKEYKRVQERKRKVIEKITS